MTQGEICECKFFATSGGVPRPATSQQRQHWPTSPHATPKLCACFVQSMPLPRPRQGRAKSARPILRPPKWRPAKWRMILTTSSCSLYAVGVDRQEDAAVEDRARVRVSALRPSCSRLAICTRARRSWHNKRWTHTRGRARGSTTGLKCASPHSALLRFLKGSKSSGLDMLRPQALLGWEELSMGGRTLHLEETFFF